MGLSQMLFAQKVTNKGVFTVKENSVLFLPDDLENNETGQIKQNGTTIIKGNWINDGEAKSDTGQVIFQGVADQHILGSEESVFHNLIVENANQIILEAPIIVRSELELADGSFDLNDNNVDLGTTGVLVNEIAWLNELYDSNTANGSGGFIQRRVNIEAGIPDNVASLGLQLESELDHNSVLIRRGHDVQTNGIKESIARYYEVAHQDGTTPVDIIFNYHDSEVFGDNQDAQESFVIWRSTDEGTTWTNAGGDANPIQRNVSNGNVGVSARLTLSSERDAPLVENVSSMFLDVTGCNVDVRWATNSEVNILEYEVERSVDGVNFEKIHQVYSSGQPFGQFYEYRDEGAIGEQTYRVKIIRLDSTFVYSESAVAISDCLDKRSEVFVYPNPVGDSHETVTVSFYAKGGEITLDFTDVPGRRIANYPLVMDVDEGWNTFHIPIMHLAAAPYFISIDANTIIRTAKIIKVTE